MRKSNELQIGKAGEYLTCYDMIMKDCIAYLSEQGLPYDVVIDTGSKLLKCQVKTTERPRVIPQRNKETLAYIFNVKRHGKNGTKRYDENEIDIFALVCLDNKDVGYIKNERMPDTLNLRVDQLRGQYHDEKGIVNFENVMKLKNKTQREISQITGLHISAISRMLQNNYKPYKTNARYFSDIKRGKEWFISEFG